MFQDIEVKSDGIYEIKKDKEGNEFATKVANYMSVINQEVNLDTNDHFVTLSFHPINGSDLVTLKVQASDIATYSSLTKLSSKGLDINEANKANVIKALRKSRGDAPYIYSHQTLGWVQRNNHLVFNHQISNGFDINSTYVGSIDIQPKGTEEAYMNMIKSEVIGNLGLELALVFGVSSAMLGLINIRYPMESLMIHLVGSSSSGKSTTAILAASVWGNCNLRENGLLASFNTTLNALQKRLSGNFGIIQCLDELNQYSGNDVTKLIYSLSEGRIRSRLNKECEMNQLESWNTVILSTGEKGILSMASNNEGLRVRLYEFTLDKWTKSATNSTNIKTITATNYGFLGIRFIEAIDSLGTDKVFNLYNQNREYLLTKLNQNQFTDRIAAKMAILLTSADILEQYMNIRLDVEAIESFIISAANEGLDEIDLSEKAFDSLKEYISTNRNCFLTHSKQKSWNGVDITPRDCKGKVFLEANGEIEKVAIQIDSFKKIIKDLGFESPKLIIDAWNKKGWLEKEAGRKSSRIVINNVKVGCYIIKVKEVEDELNKVGGSGSV